MTIVHWGMSETPEPRHKGPEPPTGPSDVSQHDEDWYHDKCHGALVFAPQGIGHMSSVELADGKEIQRRHKQAKPGGDPDGV